MIQTVNNRTDRHIRLHILFARVAHRHAIDVPRTLLEPIFTSRSNHSFEIVFRTITAKFKEAAKTKETISTTSKVEPHLSHNPEIKASAGIEVLDESVADAEIYQEYADAVLRSFP